MNRVIVCLAIDLLFGTHRPAEAQRAETTPLRTAAPDGTRVSLEKGIEGTAPWYVVRLVNSANRLDRSVRLSPVVIRGKQLLIAKDERHVVFVGDTNNGDYVAVISLDGRLVTSFMTAAAAVSPDRALIVYQSHIARGDLQPKTTYAVYAVGTPREAAMFYPVDSTAHTSESALFWVDDRIAAFMDRAGDEQLHVVAVEFSHDGAPVRMMARPLEIDALMNPAAAPGINPRRLISADSIERISPAQGLSLRLTFNSPHVRVPRLDVTFW